MQAFSRFAVIAGAVFLAGCATDGSTLLSSTDQPPPPAEEAEVAPPVASAPPPAHSTPARSSTAAKPPRQPDKEKKAASKPETKQAPPAQQASKPPAAASAPASSAAPAAAAAEGGKAFNGSWQFSNGQKACMMTLSGSGASGTVSAGGECWNAYTKAKSWKLQGNEMVLTDSGNQPIARMQSTGATRYDGYGADGEPVVLIR
ncbi:outer membrane lipoprotein [Blastochloris viridis]|nr:outer membrane lipoprotein [Blastochloris viridis]